MTYLEIAQALAAVGREDGVEAWPREGLQAFADRSWQTSPLREFLARLLRDRGDLSDAVVSWDEFERAPSLTVYRRLLDEAGEEAADVKIRALDPLAQRVEQHTYRQAVDLPARIRRLASQAGQPERCAGILERVRGGHGRKRNLMKLIDQKGW